MASVVHCVGSGLRCSGLVANTFQQLSHLHGSAEAVVIAQAGQELGAILIAGMIGMVSGLNFFSLYLIYVSVCLYVSAARTCSVHRGQKRGRQILGSHQCSLRVLLSHRALGSLRVLLC